MFSIILGKHLGPMGAVAFLGRCGRIFWRGVLLALSLHQTAEALDGPLGHYVFNDSETGEAITVWYAKPDSFSAETPVIVLPGQKREALDYRDVWRQHAARLEFMILALEFFKNICHKYTGRFPNFQWELRKIFLDPDRGGCQISPGRVHSGLTIQP